MKLYVETSAVFAWFFDEEHDDGTRAQLAAADVTFTSDLTLIECGSAIRRTAATSPFTASELLPFPANSDAASARWALAECLHTGVGASVDYGCHECRAVVGYVMIRPEPGA